MPNRFTFVDLPRGISPNLPGKVLSADESPPAGGHHCPRKGAVHAGPGRDGGYDTVRSETSEGIGLALRSAGGLRAGSTVSRCLPCQHLPSAHPHASLLWRVSRALPCRDGGGASRRDHPLRSHPQRWRPRGLPAGPAAAMAGGVGPAMVIYQVTVDIYLVNVAFTW